MNLNEKWELLTTPEIRQVLLNAGLSPRRAGYRLNYSYDQLESQDPVLFPAIEKALSEFVLDDKVRVGDYVKILQLPKNLRQEVTDPTSRYYIDALAVQRVIWIDDDGTSIEVGLYERLKLSQYEKAEEPKMVYKLRKKSIYNQFGDRILKFELADKELMKKVVDAMNAPAFN